MLDRCIGADASFFASAEGVSDVVLGLEPSVLPAARRRWAEMAAETRELLPAAQASGGVVVDSELFGSRLTRLVYYDVFMRPSRGRTTLIGFLQCRGQMVGKLVVGRKVGSPDFHARDVGRLREVLPTLSLAQRAYQMSGPRAPSPSSLWSGTGPVTSPCLSGNGLTAREREVLGYLHLGYTNEQIALALGSAPRTVRNQLSRVYQKLGVSNRAEAVAVSLTRAAV